MQLHHVCFARLRWSCFMGFFNVNCSVHVCVPADWIQFLLCLSRCILLVQMGTQSRKEENNPYVSLSSTDRNIAPAVC